MRPRPERSTLNHVAGGAGCGRRSLWRSGLVAVGGLHRPGPCGSCSCSRSCITLNHHRLVQPRRRRRLTRTAEKADGRHMKKKMQREGRHDEILQGFLGIPTASLRSTAHCEPHLGFAARGGDPGHAWPPERTANALYVVVVRQGVGGLALPSCHLLPSFAVAPARGRPRGRSVGRSVRSRSVGRGGAPAHRFPGRAQHGPVVS